MCDFEIAISIIPFYFIDIIFLHKISIKSNSVLYFNIYLGEGARAVFPNIQISHCYFHFKQSIVRFLTSMLFSFSFNIIIEIYY